MKLENTYIKNDYGLLRELYFKALEASGLHHTYPPESYKWPWVFESSLGIIQQAPFREFVREKTEITLNDFK